MSTDFDGAVQVIHFMSNAIPDVRELLKTWQDNDGYPLDPLAHGISLWHENHKHPYYPAQKNMYTALYSQEEYLVDNGATCHVTNSAEYLEDLRTKKTKIVVGENLTCAAQMSSTLHLKFDTHDEGINLLSLEWVFMVPMLNKKAISIPLPIKKESTLFSREVFVSF